MIDLPKFTDLMVNLDLNPNQAFFLLTLADTTHGFSSLLKWIHLSPQIAKSKTNRLNRYSKIEEVGTAGYTTNKAYPIRQFPKADIDDLIEKNLVYKRGHQTDSSYENFTLSETAIASLRLLSSNMADEFWDKYPRFVKDSFGRRFELKASDPETIKDAYLRAIQNNSSLHKEIMEKMDNMLATDNFPILGIAKFVATHYWKDYIIKADYSSSELI